jgi:hypothetical protein
MTTINAGDLDIGRGFKRFGTARLTEAWREAHYASQPAAELAKSWAEEKDDDSHSSFVWFEGEDGRGLEGVPAQGQKPYRARLKLEGFELSVFDGHGRTIGDLTLAGRTVEEATAWMRSLCEKELGDPKQASRPAPDLPDHPLGTGAAFTDDPEGFNDLADVYAATAGVIDRLREAVPAFGEGRCWPHHFDLATLAVLATDDDGRMTKTVGFGVTPPDSVDDEGYWYVSPWTKDGVVGRPGYPDLPDGRWVDRGGDISMAVLPVTDLAGDAEAARRLSVFVASAFNVCAGVLDV